MIYKLSNKNEKTWNDKKYVEAELTDPNGELFKVSAWAGEFDGKEEWDGELVKNEKGYWKLVTKKAVAGANFKQAQVEKSMERKEGSIAKFQDNKEWSIKVASTMGKAVDLAIAEYTINKQSLDRLDECVLKWRKWLWNNWNVDLQDTDPTSDKML